MSGIPMEEEVLFNLTAQTATSGTTTPPKKNLVNRGVRVGVNISGVTGGNLTVTVFGRDPSGSTYTLLQSAALSATAFTELLVYPGCTAASNTVANAPIPPTWGVNYSCSSGTLAFTISYSYQR